MSPTNSDGKRYQGTGRASESAAVATAPSAFFEKPSSRPQRHPPAAEEAKRTAHNVSSMRTEVGVELRPCAAAAESPIGPSPGRHDFRKSAERKSRRPPSPRFVGRGYGSGGGFLATSMELGAPSPSRHGRCARPLQRPRRDILTREQMREEKKSFDIRGAAEVREVRGAPPPRAQRAALISPSRFSLAARARIAPASFSRKKMREKRLGRECVALHHGRRGAASPHPIRNTQSVLTNRPLPTCAWRLRRMRGSRRALVKKEPRALCMQSNHQSRLLWFPFP